MRIQDLIRNAETVDLVPDLSEEEKREIERCAKREAQRLSVLYEKEKIDGVTH